MARPDKYKLFVEPYLADISEMALTMTEEQIAKTLGISLSCWKRYKNRSEPLQAALKRGRKELVKELKSSLIQKAKGFTYNEKKVTKELIDESGELTVTKEETIVKYAAPDVAAINLLLKNYDPDWRNDPAEYELKKKALELQEKKVEQNEW